MSGQHVLDVDGINVLANAALTGLALLAWAVDVCPVLPTRVGDAILSLGSTAIMARLRE
jgi:hypothetical protein